MKTKSVALLLAIIMCVGIFAGCQSSELRAYSDDPEETPANGTAETETKDFGPVYESFEPDTVMMTINGTNVTWQELFYWYYFDVSQLESYFGPITDWEEANAFDSSKTNKEYIINSALETLKHYYGLESKAAELGVKLSDEDRAEIDELWQSNVENYGKGDEKAYLSYLEEAFLSKEMFYHINEVNTLYSLMLEELYGADGEKLGDSEVLDEAGELGYMRAKHILFKTTNDSGEALSDEEMAESRATAETLLAELQAITDPAALEARFDELIAEYGQDSGTDFYTDGYTFLPGEMLAEFETAVSGLEENGLSGIVETSAGYHIILRLPLNASAIVEYASETSRSTLAKIISQKIFESNTNTWADECKVTVSKEYEDMDIGELFAKAKTVPQEPEASPETSPAAE